ncbi:MAG: HEAT repeat domain-containing protein [Anaerolineaceae bacterium]
MRRYLPEIRAAIQQQKEASHNQSTTTLEDRLRKDTLIHVQGLHIASPLFALDEILITPRLLAPPPQPDPETADLEEPRTLRVLPYLPEFPELTAEYSVPTLSLMDALKNDVNLAIIGQPGSGKTVALAYLTTLFARRAPETGDLADLFPVYMHVIDLNLAAWDGKSALDALVQVITEYAPVLSIPQVPGFIQHLVETKRLILLLDGLDELPPADLKEATAFLASLQKEAPSIRMVCAASSENLTGLTQLGFIPLALAAWNQTDRTMFIDQWGNLWRQEFSAADQTSVDPVLLNYWLISDHTLLTPLELTLRTWALFAGDNRGSRCVDDIESYLRRLLPDRKLRPAVERLAVQMTLTSQPFIARSKASDLVAEYEETPSAPTADAPEDQPAQAKANEEQKIAPISRIIPTLISSGLLADHLNDRMVFVHPVIHGYLAASALAKEPGGAAQLSAQPHWIGRLLTMKDLAALGDITPIVGNLLQVEDEPYYQGLFLAARCIREASLSARWRPYTMRRLADLMQDDRIPYNARARALAALICSNDPTINLLFAQLLKSPSTLTRCLAVFGLGALLDARTVTDLVPLLEDPDHSVQQAALVALAAIGAPSALQAVSQVLTESSDETMRRTAAEALARRSIEGYPILKDAAVSEDLLVRRAAVFGLIQIREKWAVEILEKMRIEDGQWVVRDAAVRALELVAKPDPSLPRHLPPPSTSPWLIAYASGLGVGISAGDPATDILLQAFQNGSEEDSLLALEYLQETPDLNVIKTIFDAAYDKIGNIQQAACYALWYMSVSGANMPTAKDLKNA